MSHFTLGVVNVGGGECRGGECRTIIENDSGELYQSSLSSKQE